MPTETLAGLPATAPLLARTVLTSRTRRGSTVPERTLRVEDVPVDRARLAAYQRLTGYAVSDTLPQPYPWVLAFPLQTALMVRPDFPLAAPRGQVHLESRVRTHPAPMEAARAAEPSRHPPGRSGRTAGAAPSRSTSSARVGEEPVWDCENVYLAPGRGDEDTPRGESPPTLPEGSPVARWRLPETSGAGTPASPATSTPSTSARCLRVPSA